MREIIKIGNFFYTTLLQDSDIASVVLLYFVDFDFTGPYFSCKSFKLLKSQTPPTLGCLGVVERDNGSHYVYSELKL